MGIFDTGCSAAAAGRRPGVPLCPGAFLQFWGRVAAVCSRASGLYRAVKKVYNTL